MAAYLASLYYNLQQGLRERFPNNADSFFAIAIVKLRKGEFAFVIYRKDGVPIAPFKVIAPEGKLFPLTGEDISILLRRLPEYAPDCNVSESSLERLIDLGNEAFFFQNGCINLPENWNGYKELLDLWNVLATSTARLARWFAPEGLLPPSVSHHAVTFPKEIDPSADPTNLPE
ncbi:MAG: hypothetical protein ACOX2O_06360 [Bdellovibrionota bacterium]|jgi:hypothetical protein